MIKRYNEKCLLTPEDLAPTRDDLKVISVFNPGVIEHDGEVLIMARVAERVAETRPGYHALPRWTEDGEVSIDWMAEEDIDLIDPRMVQVRKTGLNRLTFLSHLRIFRSSDGLSVKAEDCGRFLPTSLYESYGVEDPRITKIGDTYYVTYVAVSKHGASTALASTRDFQNFQRHGIIFYPENKDVVLFSEKLNRGYAALHRPNAATPFTKPEMWVAWSDDLVHWGQHEVLLGGSSEWDSGRIGAGCPPILVDDGWLEIYHGNKKLPGQEGVGPYAAGLLLLDYENPAKILKRSPEPIMQPDAAFEKDGFVVDVVFPTGIVPRGDRALVYYGAADTSVGVVEFSIQEMLDRLK
ncbi:MAG: glycoside hydrolase family 130 protein [Candidatus Sumerlaeia bacterium]